MKTQKDTMKGRTIIMRSHEPVMRGKAIEISNSYDDPEVVGTFEVNGIKGSWRV